MGNGGGVQGRGWCHRSKFGHDTRDLSMVSSEAEKILNEKRMKVEP